MRRAFIDQAIVNAEKSSLRVASHGAVVVFRGKVVGNGTNKYCHPCVNKTNTWSVHAEVDAINNALRKISPEDLRKSTLIVVRRLKDNVKYCEDYQNNICSDIGLSAPCKNCANYILKWGLKKCYYS
tara:strand:- start:1643 stop:2023 length:381 start_codon:yes stop_codon:yes gene_type:complete